MIKITDRTRIKVAASLKTEFGLNWWMNSAFVARMSYDYDMRMTSRRGGIFYFQVLDKQKFILFSLTYGNFILKN